MKAILLLTGLLSGQTDVMRLQDGSLVNGTVKADKIEVVTSYGKLTVPWAEVLSIKFGNRPTEKLEVEIQNSIRDLSSVKHQERESASRNLALIGPPALPLLLAIPEANLEAKTRAKPIIQSIRENYPERSEAGQDDLIETSTGFTIKGKVSESIFAAHGDSLGDIRVLRHNLVWLERGDKEVSLNITEAEGWVKVIAARSGCKIVVKAEGVIDLWVQSPGTYTATPRGHNAPGKTQPFLSGALIGKLGDGVPFMIGAEYTVSAHDNAVFYLSINPSTWNALSTGSFSVKVKQRRN